MQSLPGFRIAVDVGGTFTDTVLVDAKNQILASCKTPTTPENPTMGAMEGVRRVLSESGVAIPDIRNFVHGTTLATNALIERRGARTAVTTTDGFRDILEIAYERRYSQYDINLSKPDLIVPRRRCFTISERMLADGTVHVPLDTTDIAKLLAQIDECGAEAIAICFLHSYTNGTHERQLCQILQAERPNLALSLSCEISPEAREFERLCTAVANAYVQPIMAHYLIDLQSTLQTEGLICPIMMMTSGGGMTTLETAAQHPIRLVESGPAGGALLAARIAESLEQRSVLSFDMGGTTAKLCLIDDYKPQTSRKFEISRAERFIKGSGMPVRIPVIEMIEIGAGGGSIASVDRLGRIGVGPESAGSEPGPAAFAKGGTHPTVTDADVVTGFIEPGLFAEGRLQIDLDAARSALAQVGTSIGLDETAAAIGVSEIVDENMASAGRTHAVEAGKDITGRTMIAFGGNGPLHATRVARRARVSRIIVPLNPGVGSAVGFLFAPVAFEIVRSRYTRLDQLDVDEINSFFDQLTNEARSVVKLAASHGELSTTRIAFMRYHGQGHEIEIELPDRNLIKRDISELVSAFEVEYSRQFSRAVPGMSIEVLNWAVTVSTPPIPTDQASDVSSVQPIQVTATKSVICDVSGGAIEAAVFMRDTLNVGDQIAGPALIIEPQTTTLVSADFDAQVLADFSILLTKKSGAET
ncbi:MAG: hydantoinase/oxoprolinase family protein [Rhizobiaceae bacterium]|nr:hydantoinase/oxoprolinase family protein [Rhizobiaceae bacterium]